MKKNLLLILLLACCYYATAQEDKRLLDLRKTISMAKDSQLMAANMQLGGHYHQKENSDSATYYYNKALELAMKLNLPGGIASAYNNLGEMEYNYEHYEKAIELFLKSLQVSEKNNNYISAAISYARMGNVFEDQEKKDLAKDYYLRAIHAHKLASDSIRIIATYVKLAGLYLDLKDPVNSQRNIDTALTICNLLLAYEKAPNRLYALNMYRRGAMDVEAQIAEKKKDYDKAIAIYTELIKEVEDFEGVYQKADYQVDLATVCQEAGKYDQCIEHLDKALKYLKEDSIPYIYQNVYQQQSLAYSALGKYQKAYNAHVAFKEISDSILNKQNLTITTEMQTRYETDKKEQQIATLNIEKKNQRMIMGISIGAFLIALILLVFILRANRLQKRIFAKEKEIQKKEMEKRMFELEQTALRAQMNPHFIFNSLNSVQRYIINNDSDGVNRYLTTFARLIRQTLENSGKQLIPLKDEVQYLDTYLRLEQMRSNDKFSYRINVNSDVNPEETYIPNMIIQPFVENSVIHGMAGKKQHEGMINLSISKNHKLTCVLEDNGRGIHVSKQQKHVDGDDHESMGSAITEKRIEMFNHLHQEKIELQVVDKSESDNANSGTRILIKFPLNTGN